MKIRLGLLDSNQQYTSRLMAYFNAHYSEKTDIYLFTAEESFKDFSESHKIDVLIANPDTVSADFKAPHNIRLMYFSDSKDVDTVRNVRTVFRYQKADLIFKEIVSVYSAPDTDKKYESSEEPGKIIAFFGTAGGVGTTTAAVGCAMTIASEGKSVLFLPFEQNGDLKSFLDGEGNAALSDVLYAVRSRQTDPGLKLNSMVCKDASGVSYFEPFDMIQDSRELSIKDVKDMISAMTSTEKYEYIVIDLGSYYGDIQKRILSDAAVCLLVGNGSPVSNAKTARLIRAMALNDAASREQILTHTSIFYNMYGTDSVNAECEPKIKAFTKVGRYESRSSKQILKMITASGIFIPLL